MGTKYFDYIAEKIGTAKRRADLLAQDLGHRGIEGEIREIALKECIEPFLTQSFQCGNGKIIDSYQQISSQIDIVIYHKKVVPPILISSDLGLFPVECVRYAIEVKSTLSATTIKDSINKFRSISKLTSFPRKQDDGTVVGECLPATILFAFNSDTSSSEINRYLKYDTKKPPECYAICVLGKGYWYYDQTDGHWHGSETNERPNEYIEFCGFISGLMNTLAIEERNMRPFWPSDYVKVTSVLYPSTGKENA